jgi:hypothetical protein
MKMNHPRRLRMKLLKAVVGATPHVPPGLAGDHALERR